MNRELVMLYWDIGRGIVEKQQSAGWGEAVVERLAADLRAEFPGMRGFSADNVWRMGQFYTDHSSPEFLAQAVHEMKRRKKTGFLEQAVPESGAHASEFHSETSCSRNSLTGCERIVPRVPWGHHVLLMKKQKDPAVRLYYLRATAHCGWSRRVLLNQINGRNV